MYIRIELDDYPRGSSSAATLYKESRDKSFHVSLGSASNGTKIAYIKDNKADVEISGGQSLYNEARGCETVEELLVLYMLRLTQWLAKNPDQLYKMLDDAREEGIRIGEESIKTKFRNLLDIP